MYSDGKHTISGYELLAGLPRIIIAIFLGIVISTPLELKIFEDRINFQIERDNEARTTSVINEDKTTIERLQRDNAELARPRMSLLMKKPGLLYQEKSAKVLSGELRISERMTVRMLWMIGIGSAWIV